MTQYEELDQIAKKHRGVLRAKDVVEYARDPETALHSRFEWDDTEAAEKYRLSQAQHVIRCHVIQIDANDKKVRVRAYQSLPSMRGGKEYRKTEDVLKNAEWKEEMLDCALGELGAFQEKYEVLEELSSVWNAAEKVRVSRGGVRLPDMPEAEAV